MAIREFNVAVIREEGEIKEALITDTQEPASFTPTKITVRDSDDIHAKGQTLISNVYENLIVDEGSFHGVISVTWDMEEMIDPSTGQPIIDPVTGEPFLYPDEQDTVVVS